MTQAPIAALSFQGAFAFNGPLFTQGIRLCMEKEDYNQARHFDT